MMKSVKVQPSPLFGKWVYCFAPFQSSVDMMNSREPVMSTPQAPATSSGSKFGGFGPQGGAHLPPPGKFYYINQRIGWNQS